MKVKVFFIKNCYRFCIDNREVKFEEIIDIVKNPDSLNKKSECTHENPIYTFELTDSSSTGNDNNPLHLKVTKIKDKIQNVSAVDREINITVTESGQREYTFIIEKDIEPKEASCNNILLILKSIIENMIRTEEVFNFNDAQEYKVESESP